MSKMSSAWRTTSTMRLSGTRRRRRSAPRARFTWRRSAGPSVPLPIVVSMRRVMPVLRMDGCWDSGMWGWLVDDQNVLLRSGKAAAWEGVTRAWLWGGAGEPKHNGARWAQDARA